MRRSIQLLTLHCVLVVAEEGSFLGAEQRLNMHHTAVSRRVRDLELTLGVTLFDRNTCGARPTMAGERFIANLRRVMGDLDMTLSMVEVNGRGRSGRLSIGIDAPLPACGYLDAVVAFMHDRPEVDIRFTEAPRPELNAALGSRAIDVVIAHSFDRRGDGDSLRLWRDRMVVAMPAEHKLAGRAHIEWDEVVGETVLVNQQSADLGTLCGIGASAPFPSVVRHDVSRLSLLNLVRTGLGVTLLAESDAASVIDGVVAPTLHCDGKPVRLRYDAHWRPHNSNPVLAVFIAFLRTKYTDS